MILLANRLRDINKLKQAALSASEQKCPNYICQLHDIEKHRSSQQNLQSAYLK